MGNQIPAGRGPFSEREWAILQAQADLIREHIATGPQRSDSGAPNPTQVTDPSLVSDTPDATSLVPVSGELEREWDNDA